ncbi:hypothetical protein GOBAR_DD16304 [Gossypium barbadense]|nr:hypothetical protein GOBAR_DD16304 [Gossypium barbadense]
MKLIEDDNTKTMIALYCSPGNVELVELVNDDPVQNATPLNQQYGVQDSYTEVLRASANSRSSVYRIGTEHLRRICIALGPRHKTVKAQLLMVCVLASSSLALGAGGGCPWKDVIDLVHFVDALIIACV